MPTQGKTVTVVEVVPASELAKIRTINSTLVKRAAIYNVVSPQSENHAYEILRQIAARKKELEKVRIAITKPLNASLKAANALFKEVKAPLDEANTILRNKILDFQAIQRKKADKEMERREKIQASHEARGHETHEIAEVAPDVGKSTVIKRWTYEVVDITKVPRDYLELNTGVTYRAVQSGVREIAGLRIYETEGLSVR